VKGIDTNVIVRYLVADDPAQTHRVERFLAASRVAGERVYVSCIILCETSWVLRRVFGQSRPQTLNHLERILDTEVFEVEEEESVRAALQLCRKGKGDFADYLIGRLNLARGCRFTVTFDRSLRSDSAFSVL
jgi:predicted nucleic-acid-binding protein